MVPRKSDRDVVTETNGRNAPPPMTGLNVIHRCDNYVVVDKRYDSRISGDFEHTVEKLLLQEHAAIFPCHRLDYATSGAMIWALNSEAAAKASKCFRRRNVIKLYLALVQGHIEGPTLEDLKASRWHGLQDPYRMLDWPIGPDEEHGFRMKVLIPSQGGKVSQTRMKVVSRGECCGKKASKVILQPETGRRHQLRVHMMKFGHPIIGDATYTDDFQSPRMMLHAWSLTFVNRSIHDTERKAGEKGASSDAMVLCGLKESDASFLAPDPLEAFYDRKDG
ncbi:hypothetical protein GUITHDRAFT_114772 [Guillardia theta CCMP2712]|uniref:Pseudouridine synthase RsuA/RluA-like domain-containing protein n=1 Tax=Guillardia theta (strain CCMP2712) TaxID=905079 RepID=L1IS66_GUITC|nr:hypothetical protein GUITHDRAFT_114772 [Guillardia theta CCMP2712]EKX39111.1 hypothetical protein GUITHDRAFT_114772 [Guillardia theta CCMP2712]|eukprot:XP_005826091.1 hypothetical protein GUITHDRAFT_114772 [Guillardia theta CCMP2712]